jgi:hypothetical protein
MSTTRLRKTFAYPDSDSDSEPEGIDEQEQEQLINQFVETDARKTENYKVCYIFLPYTPPTQNLTQISTESIPCPAAPLHNPLYTLPLILHTTHTPARHNIAPE